MDSRMHGVTIKITTDILQKHKQLSLNHLECPDEALLNIMKQRFGISYKIWTENMPKNSKPRV
jgi:hypothetical protein